MYFYGIGSYFIGYMITQKKRKLNLNYRFKDKNKFRRNLFVTFLLISLIFLFLRSFRAIPLWLSGGVAAVKLSLFGGGDELNGSSLEDIAYAYFAMPMQITAAIYMVICLFLKKNDKLIISLSLFLMLLMYVASATKFILSQFIFLSVGYLLCVGGLSFKNIIQKYKKIIFVCSLIGVFLVVLLSMKDDFLVSVYTYICGCIPMADITLIAIKNSPKYMGLVTFNGLLRVFFQITALLGIGGVVLVLLNTVFVFTQQTQATTLIGPGVEYNAYVSMFTNFYMDGGLPAVIILSTLFGVLSAMSMNHVYNKPSFLSVGLLLYVILMIFGSMIRIDFMMVYNTMALIFVYLLFPRDSISLFSFRKK